MRASAAAQSLGMEAARPPADRFETERKQGTQGMASQNAHRAASVGAHRRVPAPPSHLRRRS
jgi:hypothetical protein